MHCLILVDEQSVWGCQDPMSISEWKEFLNSEGVEFKEIKPMNFGAKQNSDNHRRFNG